MNVLAPFYYYCSIKIIDTPSQYTCRYNSVCNDLQTQFSYNQVIFNFAP